jgi:ABC-type branched-subunit amino acid transport system ATPase component
LVASANLWLLRGEDVDDPHMRISHETIYKSLFVCAYLLECGRVIMPGRSAELANNKQVQSAYLGI